MQKKNAKSLELNQLNRKKNYEEKFSQEVMNNAKECGVHSMSDSIYAKAIAQDPLMCDKYEAIETMLYEVRKMDVEFFNVFATVEVLDEANQLSRDVKRLVGDTYK